jgi:hypothetical protein
VSDQPIHIVRANPAGGYRLRLDFDDGTAQTADFQPFLARSRHPEFRAFLDPARFASFRLDHGELVWGDYELCFPIIDLYRNRIEHRDARETAA